jgi:hypothetical protein
VRVRGLLEHVVQGLVVDGRDDQRLDALRDQVLDLRDLLLGVVLPVDQLGLVALGLLVSSLLPPLPLWPQAVRARAREAAPAMAVRAALRLRMIIILDVLDRARSRGTRILREL